MTKLRCCFCQQELEERHAATTDYNSMFITYYCGNPECESTTDLVGCKEFWDILGQLIRTRKALDVATGFIKGISQTAINDCDNQYVVLGNFKKFAEDTLNQIKTALEQKDVK